MQKVITVRMLGSLHEALKELAYRRRVSVNAMCVWLVEEAVKADPEVAKILQEGAVKTGEP